MRYLVVLDSKSPAGLAYVSGNNDGMVTIGTDSYPALDCVEIQMDQPYYLYANREMKKPAGEQQTLHLPHSAVALIVGYADDGPRPMGFV